jgi:hypothetical protein
MHWTLIVAPFEELHLTHHIFSWTVLRIPPSYRQQAMASWPGFGFQNPRLGPGLKACEVVRALARLGLAYWGLGGRPGQAEHNTTGAIYRGTYALGLVGNFSRHATTSRHRSAMSFMKLPVINSELDSLSP